METNYQTVVDNTTTPWITYYCIWEIWRATSQALWQIFIVDVSWNIKYPEDTNWEPSDKFQFIADNRATLTYSYNK